MDPSCGGELLRWIAGEPARAILLGSNAAGNTYRPTSGTLWVPPDGGEHGVSRSGGLLSSKLLNN